MAYRFRAQQPVATEVVRIADKQLRRAMPGLRAVGALDKDDAVHGARRRVKKVRALLRLVRPALGESYRAANRRLRQANRLLGPIGDGWSIIDALTEAERTVGPDVLGPPNLATVRAALLRRLNAVDTKAAHDKVLVRVRALLRAQRRHLQAITFEAAGVEAIAPGLEHTARAARRAMARAALRPTSAHHHAWRRRVKDLWCQVRLIEPLCHGTLTADRRRLSALEEALGEYHNLLLLRDLLAHEPLLSRQSTALWLRLLRRHGTTLRRRALTLGARALVEKPHHFVRRVRRLWHDADAPGRQRRRRVA